MAEDDSIAIGTIAVTVPNLEAFNDDEGKPKTITSTIENIGGLTWQLKVRKALNPPGLYLSVHCNEQVKARLWLCKVQRIVKSFVEGVKKEWPYGSYDYGHVHFFNSSPNWCLQIDENLKLSKKPLEIELKLIIVKLLESFPPLDTSLVVNRGQRSETFFVNKHALADHSSYFRNLFFGDWRDKGQKGGNSNMFELNEPKGQSFKTMIYASMTLAAMMPEPRFLDYTLAYEIIKLAIKYDFPLMLDCCEKFLIGAEMNSYQKLELLELADQFSLLDRLKEHCLNKMSVLDFVENYAKSTEMQLSKATEERLQEKLGGKAKESRQSVEALKGEGINGERVKKLINAIED